MAEFFFSGSETTPDEGTAPMFPLPGVYLFPRQVLPLHVFEPRYRQMVEDILDGTGRIVMASVPLDAERDEPRPIRAVGGLGEILRHQRHDDGRYDLLLLGLARVDIEEMPSDRLYRQASWRKFSETEPDTDSESTLREELQAAAEQHVPGDLDLPEGTGASTLADLLLQILDLPDDERAALFAEPLVERRARRALELAAR